MDMVRLAKRLTHSRRVGHGGTLDPAATGVLPICFGQATRVMEYLVDGRKLYRAHIRLGIATDTYDSLGTTTLERDPSGITRDHVEKTLPSFIGTIEQRPPMYSALKYQGERLYKLARAGIQVKLPLRTVQVHRIEFLSWDPPFFTVEVECGRGVYMRSLVHDLGNILECGAHLDALIRLSAGPFLVDNAVSVQQLQMAANDGSWRSLLKPPDVVLKYMDPIQVDSLAERTLRNGQPVPLDPRTHYAQHMERRRAYGTGNRFVGVVCFNKAKSLWQPAKLFHLSDPSPYAP